MDKALPKLLVSTLSSLLENHYVSKWKLVCGKNNTLVIHWDNNGCHVDSNEVYNSHSIYKKKTPCQRRRDQRRSDNWRAWNTPDSGYGSTPGRPISGQLNGHCDMSMDKESEGCMVGT